MDIGVKIFYNTAGELSLLESWTSPIQNDTTAIETGDIDGDGWIDLIIGHNDNETFLFRNNNGLIEDLPLGIRAYSLTGMHTTDISILKISISMDN